jgi:hypothetical protein
VRQSGHASINRAANIAKTDSPFKLHSQHPASFPSGTGKTDRRNTLNQACCALVKPSNQSDVFPAFLALAHLALAAAESAALPAALNFFLGF